MVVTFNKLDGDERIMTCTKKFELITNPNRSNGQGASKRQCNGLGFKC